MSPCNKHTNLVLAVTTKHRSHTYFKFYYVPQNLPSTNLDIINACCSNGLAVGLLHFFQYTNTCTKGGGLGDLIICLHLWYLHTTRNRLASYTGRLSPSTLLGSHMRLGSDQNTGGKEKKQGNEAKHEQ